MKGNECRWLLPFFLALYKQSGLPVYLLRRVFNHQQTGLQYQRISRLDEPHPRRPEMVTARRWRSRPESRFIHEAAKVTYSAALWHWQLWRGSWTSAVNGGARAERGVGGALKGPAGSPAGGVSPRPPALCLPTPGICPRLPPALGLGEVGVGYLPSQRHLDYYYLRPLDWEAASCSHYDSSL